MRVLFLCSRNQWRSPTAEAMCRDDPRVEARSAGIATSARRRVTEELLRWADLVCVMEHSHKQRLGERFPTVVNDLHIEVLDITDDHAFMDPELVEIIRSRVEPLLPRLPEKP